MSDRDRDDDRDRDRDDDRDRDRDRDRDDRDDRDRDRDRDRDSGGKRLKGEAVRWHERGFGFIKPDDGGEDVFCHISAIQDGNMLKEGATVEYELKFDERRGKPRAENVTGGYHGDDRGPPPRRDRRRSRSPRRRSRSRDRYNDRRRSRSRDRRRSYSRERRY